MSPSCFQASLGSRPEAALFLGSFELLDQKPLIYIPDPTSSLALVAYIMDEAYIPSYQVTAPHPSFCRFLLLVTQSCTLPCKMNFTGRSHHLEDA